MVPAAAAATRSTGRETQSGKCAMHHSESTIPALGRHFDFSQPRFSAFEPSVDSTPREARSEERTVPAWERTAHSSERPSKPGSG